ncbi:MAG: UvrD-helicase domain-containing protein, partial [Clostridia bacterium]|nr:UvrD-helicase domain-containing protein [Clostridia bacterium]
PYPEQRLEQLCQMFAQTEMERSPWYAYFRERIGQSLAEVRPAFAEVAEYAKAHRAQLGDNTADQRLEDLSAIDAALAAWQEGKIPSMPVFGSLSRLSPKFKNYEAYRPIQPKAKAAREQIKKIYHKLYIPTPQEFARQQEQCYRLAQGMRQVALRYYEADRAAKRRKNVLSFADASRLTLSLLVDHYDSQTDTVTISDLAHAYVAGELGGRIEEVLIDEYQDTNLLQNLIFRALSEDGKNLFCVGDLKQSIYRFRQARPDLFADELRRFSRKDGVFPQVQFLTRNFRSSKGVLGFVNFFFALVMSQVSGGADYDHSQWAYVAGTFPSGDYATEILLCDENDAGWQAEDRDEQSDSDYRQGMICAARIRELMQEKRTVWDAKTKQSRPLDYSDILILMRVAKGHADTVVRALSDAGIPAYSAKAKNYFDRYEVKFVLSFLRAVDNPYLDIPMAAALRSPIFCFSAQELCDLRENGRGCLYDCLCRSQDEKAKRAKAVIDRYRIRSGAEPVYRLIWDLYGEFSLFAAVGA